MPGTPVWSSVSMAIGVTLVTSEATEWLPSWHALRLHIGWEGFVFWRCRGHNRHLHGAVPCFRWIGCPSFWLRRRAYAQAYSGNSLPATGLMGAPGGGIAANFAPGGLAKTTGMGLLHTAANPLGFGGGGGTAFPATTAFTVSMK